MTGKTHVAGGFLFGSAATLLIQKYFHEITQQNEMIFCISTAAFSSVCARLPDIDEKDSTIGRKLWFISWPIYLLQCIIKIPSLFGIKLFKRANKLVGHRGFTHYPLTWLILSTMAAGFGSFIYQSNVNLLIRSLLISIALGFSIGILSHIVYDFISGKIQLLGPISQKEYGISIIKYNSIFDKLIIRSTSYVAAVKIVAIYHANIV